MVKRLDVCEIVTHLFSKGKCLEQCQLQTLHIEFLDIGSIFKPVCQLIPGAATPRKHVQMLNGPFDTL